MASGNHFVKSLDISSIGQKLAGQCYRFYIYFFFSNSRKKLYFVSIWLHRILADSFFTYNGMTHSV